MEDVKLKSALGVKTLLGIKGLGPTTLHKMLNKFNTLQDILNAPEDDLRAVANAPIRTIFLSNEQAVKDALEAAEKELFAAYDIGAVVYSIFDEGYPLRLSQIPDAPLVIYTSGDLKLLDKSVACIGARQPSDFGAAVARKVTATLAEAGWTIVSGLSNGIDSICHNVALNSKTPTAAIVGSGIDTYKSNAAYELVSRIMENGGVVISEQPLGKDYDPVSLTRRYRIETGVSVSTFFLQDETESMSLHAVKYALLQGKPIYVPGIPEAYRSELLNHGAINMANMSAQDFGKLIHAKDSIVDAIDNLERNHVGIEISGKDYYPQMLSDLEAYLENENDKVSTPKI